MTKTIATNLQLFRIVSLFFCIAAVAAQESDLDGEHYLDLPLEELLKLDAVTVTARKRVENLQDVPISVSALRGELLDTYSSGASDVRFMNARIPSLTVESSFGRTAPRFYIRGLGNTDFDLNASQPVSIVLDEVVQENPILKGFPVFDLERIEVLRGPQGSLFGRNTPAGVVKFESKKPTREPEAYSSITYGRYDTVDFEGAVSGPISEELSARLSLLQQQRSNYVDNAAPGFVNDDVLDGFRDTAGRIQILFEPDDAFTALFNYHFRDLNGTPAIFRANVIEPGTNDLVHGFNRSTVFQDAAGTAHQDLQVHGGSLRLEFQADRHQYTSVTGVESADLFSRADVDGGFGAAFLPPEQTGPGTIPFPSETADGLRDHIQFTQELRLASHEADQLRYQIGLFYFYEDLTVDSFSFDTLNGGVQNGYAVQEQQSWAAAVFGTLSYDVTDRLTLTAGSRQSIDDKRFSAERLQDPFGGASIGPIKVETDDSHLSWDVSAVYELTNDVNVFARIANGFRAPSIQGRILFGDDVTVADTEEVLSYEVGVKSDILDGSGRINATAFMYTMDGQQLTAVGGNANVNQLVNADETVGYGLEVDAELNVNKQLTLSAGLSYNHTELKDSQLAIAPCAQCTTTDPTNAGGQAIINGNSLPHAPEWIANVAARYSLELGSGELYVLTDWFYRSEINLFLYESKEFRGGEMIEGGLRIGYQWTNRDIRYDVAVFSRNITDEEALIGGIDFNNLTGIVNAPRFFGCELKIAF